MDDTAERERLVRRVGQELGRELTTANVFLHARIAEKVGLNATDTRCIEILGRSAPDMITAGDLRRLPALRPRE